MCIREMLVKFKATKRRGRQFATKACAVKYEIVLTAVRL